MSRHRMPRRRGPFAVGGATIAFAALLLPLAVTPSAAAWIDREWIASDTTALDCSIPGAGESSATGRLLQGTLLGADLDAVAAVPGVRVDNDGSTATPTPADAPVVPASGGTAYQDPLTVSALSSVSLPLGSLLALPLETDTGVYNQYARADDRAGSAAAAGLVTDSGGIDLGPFQAPREERPELGTIQLGALLEASLGGSLADLVAQDLTSLGLQVGAVAGAASLDGCAAAWTGDVYGSLTRDYAIAGLDLVLESPLVDGLTSALSDVLNSVETSVSALAGNQGVLAGIRNGVLDLVSGLLGVLSIQGATVDLSVTAELASARALLTSTIADEHGILGIDLADGTITIDLAALLGQAYGSTGLNGLPPNTELLVDEPVLAALSSAVAAAVSGLVVELVGAIEDDLDLVDVHASVNLPILGVSLGTTYALAAIDIVVEGSLEEILDGDVGAEVSLRRDNTICAIPLVGLLCAGLNGILAEVRALAGDLTGVVGDVVDGALATVRTGLEPALEAALVEPVGALAGTLDAVLGGLLGPGGLVSVVVNAQNDPDPAAVGAGPAPSSWAAIPGTPTGPPFDTGRYDVAALVIGVVGAIDAVELSLARASVGGNAVGASAAR